MYVAKSALSVTNFDEHAARRQAADLRTRFFLSCATRGWNALRRQFFRRVPRGTAHA